jgi:hypothetical protein
MNVANPDQQMVPGGLFLLPSMVVSATPSGVFVSPSGAIAVLHAEAATHAEVSAYQAAGDKDQHLASSKPATHAAVHAVLLATGVSSVWVALASSGKSEDVAVACIDRDPAAIEATVRAATAAKWIVDAVEHWSPTRMPATLNGEQGGRQCRCSKRSLQTCCLQICCLPNYQLCKPNVEACCLRDFCACCCTLPVCCLSNCILVDCTLLTCLLSQTLMLDALCRHAM